jgi:hypothetical protein
MLSASRRVFGTSASDCAAANGTQANVDKNSSVVANRFIVAPFVSEVSLYRNEQPLIRCRVPLSTLAGGTQAGLRSLRVPREPLSGTSARRRVSWAY